MPTQSPSPRPWRVCVTRDEPVDGPLAAALRAQAFLPVLCPVLTLAPPADPGPLAEAARDLEGYDWIVCASARAVVALSSLRQGPWPSTLQAAAVGATTAQALRDAGVASPVTADEGGAEPLWAALAGIASWPGTRVLVPTTPGGRTVLAEQLRAAGARVDDVEAYRMVPRDPGAIARDWTAAAPEAVVIASPRVARCLAGAVGAGALARLHAVVAIGATTAAALHDLAVPCVTASATSFASAAATLAARRAAKVHG